MRWVMGGFIMDLSLFSRVLSEHAIHNKSYYSPLSSERGCGRGFFTLQSLFIGIEGEAFFSYKKKGAESNSAPFELYVSFVYFNLLS